MDQTPVQFERIVDEYVDYAYAVAYRLLCNAEDAQDAVQDTFIKLHNNFGRYNREKNLKNWVCTIALNSARDIYRKRKGHAESAIDEELCADDNPLPDQSAINRVWVRRMLASLSFNHRAVMVMFYIERRSVRDIARRLKRPEVLVKVWLHRARSALVKRFGGEEA